VRFAERVTASEEKSAAVSPDDRADPAVLRVARQPILDPQMRLLGYELLFREPPAEHAEVHDDRAATATVIVDGLFDVGLFDLVGGTLAYLNVSREFLLNFRPLSLPAQHVVLELLEDEQVDDELLEVLQELVDAGFAIALDDFRMTPATEQLLDYAQVIKLDVLEHTTAGLEELVARLRAERPSLSLIAEKVESREIFEQCLALGVQGFQGYFFAKPSLVQRSRLPSQGFSALGAIADMSATEDFDELNRIITRDAGLSMRLLRYANSAYVALPRRVSSVHEGLTWLGASTVRRFGMMVALASARDVPDVLLVTALVRANMCQIVSGVGQGPVGDSYFTVGLFSVADALANAPMHDVIEQLPFREDVAAALLRGSGDLGTTLTEVIAYERGDFDAAGALIHRYPNIQQIYRESAVWADLSIRGLI
jgi:EAL and modified HD-GYP domain-containing signal transduction protein